MLALFVVSTRWKHCNSSKGKSVFVNFERNVSPLFHPLYILYLAAVPLPHNLSGGLFLNSLHCIGFVSVYHYMKFAPLCHSAAVRFGMFTLRHVLKTPVHENPWVYLLI